MKKCVPTISQGVLIKRGIPAVCIVTEGQRKLHIGQKLLHLSSKMNFSNLTEHIAWEKDALMISTLLP